MRTNRGKRTDTAESVIAHKIQSAGPVFRTQVLRPFCSGSWIVRMTAPVPLAPFVLFLPPHFNPYTLWSGSLPVDYLTGKPGLSPPCLFLFLLSGPLCVRQSACPRIWLSHDCGFPITPALPPKQHSPVPSSFMRMDGNSTLKRLIFFLFLGFQRGHRGRWAPELQQTLIPLLTCGRHSAALPRWPSSWSSEVPVAEVDWGPAGWFFWTSSVSGSRISWGFQNGWEGHLQRHSLYFLCVSVCVSENLHNFEWYFVYSINFQRLFS